MESFGMIDPRRYAWGILITDLGSGIAALFLVFIAALALGGFSFIQPWFIVTPVLMLVLGWKRGRSIGNLWLKSFMLAAPALLVFVWFTQTDSKADYSSAALVIIALTILPVAGGIKIRRRQAATSLTGE